MKSGIINRSNLRENKPTSRSQNYVAYQHRITVDPEHFSKPCVLFHRIERVDILFSLNGAQNRVFSINLAELNIDLKYFEDCIVHSSVAVTVQQWILTPIYPCLFSNCSALGQNPLHCDCNGKWLNSFFRQQFLDNGIALCHSPDNMRFKSLYHSKPGDFVCPWIRRTEQNQSTSTEDLVIGSDTDEHGSENDNIPHETRDWWTARSVSTDDMARMSSEELASLAVASKCSPCMVNPCMNGGQCVAHGQLDFQCTCPTSYHGKRCEEEQNACSQNPCQNGGQCELIEIPSGYR